MGRVKDVLDKKVNDADYSINRLRINVYTPQGELTISSAPGKQIDVKAGDLPKLIKTLQTIQKEFKNK